MSGIVVGVNANKGGVGKSVVSALLAAAGVRLGFRTVLFDLDPSNPDQLSRQRVQFTSVPGRMPSLLDDTYPSQWWSDPDTGVQLVPGPRAASSREASAVASAAVRMVERARRDRDLIVLDMHQVSADHYTKLLGELVDVMVCVTDHDPQSREHLRSWLDEATYDGVRERGRYVPVLDANQVRLVFVEGVRLSKSQAAKTMDTARLDMGPAYRWSTRFEFDEAIVTGGSAGDLVRAAGAGSHRAALELAASVVGEPVPAELVSEPSWLSRFRRSGQAWPGLARLPLRLVDDGQLADVVLPVSADPVVAVLPESVVTGTNTLRVLGVPALFFEDRTVDVDDQKLAAIALVALVGPVAVSWGADQLGVSNDEFVALVSDDRFVQINGLLAVRSVQLRVDALAVQTCAERLTGDMGGSEAARIADGLVALRAVGDGVLSVDRSSPWWRWAFEPGSSGSSPFADLVREVENLASLVATAWVTATANDVAGLPPADEVIGAITGVARQVGVVVNPLPMVSAASEVAKFGSPAHREATKAATTRLWSADRLSQAEVAAVLDELAARIGLPTATRPDPFVPTSSVTTDHGAAQPPFNAVAAAETNEIEILDESDGELVEQFDVAESVTVFEPANALGSPRSGSVVEGVSPVSLAERLSAPMSSVRRVTLRTMGQVRVDGAELSGASSVPFVVAASGRPMSAGEVADLTGYSKKTIANTYPVGGVVLDRADAHLTLASGVFTEHGWLVECGELAQRALAAGDTATAEWWTVQLALALEEVGGAPYESFPMNRVSGKDQTDPWSWVDDFPSSVSDRYAVGQAVAGAAMTLARLSAPVSSVPPSSAIELLVKIARLVPYAAQRSMDGSRLGSSGETLLGAAAIVAGSDQGLLGTVQQQARVLIDAGTIAAGDDLVGALGL